MRTCGLEWTPATGLAVCGPPVDAGLTLFFGPRSLLERPEAFAALRAAQPEAILLGCSTGGQIVDGDVGDDRICGVNLAFDGTRIRLARACRKEHPGARAVGEALGAQLAADDLAGAFILADGLSFDGAALVGGLASKVGAHVPLTGGLAGDGADFVSTLVAADAPPASGVTCAVGFYGESVRIGHGCAGGWDVFGPRRRITRSRENVVYEFDGKPALDLYERYLGEEAAGLPGTGLLFPLRIFDPARPGHDIVRTILAIDRNERSITFAGSMPQGWVSQLMRGSLDRLTKIAGQAAESAKFPNPPNRENVLAVLVSCIGRRLLMGQRAPEEAEAVRAAFGDNVPTIGFYSYGEISPHGLSGLSELHNQTMTVMTIMEDAA